MHGVFTVVRMHTMDDSFVPCTSLPSGNATRFCGSDGQWGEVNVLNCTSREFVELEEMLVSFVAEINGT